jgi:hypothetical protein
MRRISMAKKKRSAEVSEAAAELSEFSVLSNLLHHGKLYRKGSTVLLTAAESLPLLRHKTVEAIKDDESEESN